MFHNEQSWPAPHTDTSRPIRPGEKDGCGYWFTTREKMDEDIANHKYLEYGEYEKHLYGTKLDSIRQVMRWGILKVWADSGISGMFQIIPLIFLNWQWRSHKTRCQLNNSFIKFLDNRRSYSNYKVLTSILLGPARCACLMSTLSPWKFWRHQSSCRT